jgi:hypothetical protein
MTIGNIDAQQAICRQKDVVRLVETPNEVLNTMVQRGYIPHPATTSRKAGRRYTPMDLFRIDRLNSLSGVGCMPSTAASYLDLVLPPFHERWEPDSPIEIFLAAVDIKRDQSNVRLVFRRRGERDLFNFYPEEGEPWGPGPAQAALLLPLSRPWEHLLSKLWELYFAPKEAAP